jgi:hypothetical protein
MNSKQLIKDVKALAEVIKDFKVLGQIEAWEERIIYCEEIENKLRNYLDLVGIYNTREEVSPRFPFAIHFDENAAPKVHDYGLLEILSDSARGSLHTYLRCRS